MKGIPMAHIGHVNEEEQLIIHGLDGKVIIDVPTADLKEAWQKPLRW